MEDFDHSSDHKWVQEKRVKEVEWKSQMTKLYWTVAITLTVGLTTSIISLLWWMVKLFVERGGKI